MKRFVSKVFNDGGSKKHFTQKMGSKWKLN